MAAELTDAQIDHVWDIYVGPASEKYPLTASDKRCFARAILALATQPPAQGAEPVAWEAPEGLGIVRFVSDRRYRLFSPKIRAYYKPYRCSQCTAPPPTTEVENAITGYLEARDALDSRELTGINGEPWDVLQRRVHAARKDLDAALQSEAQAGKGDGHDQ